MIKLYTTGCPKCKILEKKLDEKGVRYEKITNIDVMKTKGFRLVPMLEIGTELFDFGKAIRYVNDLEVN